MFDTLELLFTKPMKLKEVKALKDYCEKNNIKSKNSEWLFSIDEKYDKEAILEDVRKCKKEYETKSNLRRVIGFVLIAVACTLFGTCCKLTYQTPQGDPMAILGLLVGSIILGRFGLKRFANPEVHYNETTTKFVEDFKKKFPNG